MHKHYMNTFWATQGPKPVSGTHLQGKGDLIVPGFGETGDRVGVFDGAVSVSDILKGSPLQWQIAVWRLSCWPTTRYQCLPASPS